MLLFPPSPPHLLVSWLNGMCCLDRSFRGAPWNEIVRRRGEYGRRTGFKNGQKQDRKEEEDEHPEEQQTSRGYCLVRTSHVWIYSQHTAERSAATTVCLARRITPNLTYVQRSMGYIKPPSPAPYSGTCTHEPRLITSDENQERWKTHDEAYTHDTHTEIQDGAHTRRKTSELQALNKAENKKRKNTTNRTTHTRTQHMTYCAP